MSGNNSWDIKICFILETQWGKQKNLLRYHRSPVCKTKQILITENLLLRTAACGENKRLNENGTCWTAHMFVYKFIFYRNDFYEISLFLTIQSSLFWSKKSVKTIQCERGEFNELFLSSLLLLEACHFTRKSQIIFKLDFLVAYAIVAAFFSLNFACPHRTNIFIFPSSSR